MGGETGRGAALLIAHSPPFIVHYFPLRNTLTLPAEYG
jgi:hypothetical protein